MEKFKKVFTAIVTPFKKDKIDFDSLEKLIQFQLQNGIEGFVVNGTTAESPNLEIEEVYELFKFVKLKAGKNIPLIVGTGSNSTKKTVELSIKAEEWGADGLLVVVPYYNKPPQQGLYAHFETVANSVKTPIILYNVPGRTITSLEPPTLARLSRIKNIVGIKEATGNIELFRAMKAVTPESFIYLSGDDGTYADFLKAGGHGVISVVTHVVPKEFMKITNFSRDQKWMEAANEQIVLKNLIDLLFIEANPIPVKKALQIMGIIESDELRLPLVTMTVENSQKLASELTKRGLV